MREWSKYQKAVFEAVRETNDSLLIEAVAGSGKTTTIIEAINHVPKDKSILLLAFNKGIQLELERRITASNAKCLTLHSCGFSAWKRFTGGDVQVDSGKVFQLQKESLSWPERQRNGKLGKLLGLAEGAGIVPGAEGSLEAVTPLARIPQGRLSLADLPSDSGNVSLTYKGLLDDDLDNWRGLMEEYDIGADEVDIAAAKRILKASIDRAFQTVDFDDMLYMPVIASVPFPAYDVVFVDEAQDLSGIQRVMIQRMLGPDSRIIAVGDSRQAIYHFRGASSDSMPLIQQDFRCKSLPLSISYRCPRKVVEHAQQWVEHIEWAEGAEDGEVQHLEGFDLKGFRASDAILCRLTRPLVSTAFRLIRNKIPCRILGRDIGSSLITLVKKSKIAPECPIRQFSDWLEDYLAHESKKLSEAEETRLLGVLNDKVETLRVFLSSASTVGGLIQEIEQLFQDNGSGVTLSTIHKAKGMEWERVFILDAPELMPCKWASNLQEELNLCYVAATRAQKGLIYVCSDGLEAGEKA